MTTPWTLLIIAALLEVCWATGLKYTDGFRNPIPSLFVVITLAGSMFLLAWAARTLPIGTAYAVWVGIGALGTAILGIVLFKEPASIPRIICLVMLVASIIGLKLTSGDGGNAG
jgi:quaternary ammonium compound-resistance protein SugE